MKTAIPSGAEHVVETACPLDCPDSCSLDVTVQDGRVTAIDGRTITVETRTGSVKVTLAANATVEKVSSGATSDLKVGDTVSATGDRNSDGSVNATSIAQVPQELQALVGALGGTTP